MVYGILAYVNRQINVCRQVQQYRVLSRTKGWLRLATVGNQAVVQNNQAVSNARVAVRLFVHTGFGGLIQTGQALSIVVCLHELYSN